MKKGNIKKLKTCQKLQPILDEQEPLVQSAWPKQCNSVVEEVCIHQESVHCSIYIIWHLKINANSGFHARENFYECRNYIYLTVVNLGSCMKQMSKWRSLIGYLIHSAKIFLITYGPSSLDSNTPNRPVHEKMLMLDKS